MKIIFRTLFIAFLMITLCACGNSNKNKDMNLYESIKDRKEFVVGINQNSKPFAYYDVGSDELKGFDADLIREISRIIFGKSVHIKFEPVTPSNRIFKLNSAETDIIISTMTINRERLKVVDFSNPYFKAGQALMVKADSNIRTGKDLNYKKVGIVLGTTADANIKYIAQHAIISGFKNYKDAFAELQEGNVDAISTDDVILQGILSEEAGYKILPDRYSTEFYGIALRKDEKSKSLKDEINEALAILEKTGKTKKLEEKYHVNYRR